MAARRERMASVDHAWLRMDDPTNLMMITGVLTFSEPLDYLRLQTTIEERLLRFDRFRQRAVPADGRLNTAHWEFDPHFDIYAHLRKVTLPEPGDRRALQELASELMSVPLNPERPLWQFHLIEEYDGGSALIARLHHCIADGIALTRVLLSITDEEPDATWQPKERKDRRPFGRALAKARDTLSFTGHLLHEGMETVLDPGRIVDAARTGTAGVARLAQILVRWPDPKTIFKGQLGVPKRAAWSKAIRLSDVKAVCEVTGGTVNDVLLTAMSGALRAYLEQQGQDVDGLNFHAVIPVNLRPLDGPIELGNKFGLVFLSLPIGVADVIERLEELKRRMDELKQSPEPGAIFALLNIVGLGPVELENLLVTIFGTKATGVMTNVPGPRQQLYVAGSPLEDIMFWVPQSGRLGLGVSILSYNGKVFMGVATDAGLVPDPEQIIDALYAEFAEMMELVRMVRSDEVAAEPAPTRCHGTTQAGNRCRNRARPGALYCHVHQPEPTGAMVNR